MFFQSIYQMITAGTATDKRPYTKRNGTSAERKRTGIPGYTGCP